MAKKKLTIYDVLVPKDEIPYEVPENWCWVKLGKIATIKTGKKDANYGTEDGEYPFFTCAVKPIKSPGYTYDEEALLVPGNGNIGTVLYYKGKFEAYQRTYIISEFKGNLKYLYYYFKFRWKDYNNDKLSGSTISYIKLKNLTEYEVCLPPLDEQVRIVSRIESLFDKVDKAAGLVDETRDGFEKRRAAILDRAFSGELTKKWREENRNIEFAKINKKEVEGYFEIPENWKWIESKDIFIDLPRNGYSPKSTETPTPYKTLKLGAITKGYFDDEQIKYINEEIPEDSRLWLKNGDFLIQRSNSIDYVGTCAIYTGNDNEYIYPDLIMRAELNKEIIISNWAVYYINSYYGRNYFVNNATGTAGNMPKINQKVVISLPIPIPPTEEQKELVKIMDRLFEKEKSINELIYLDELIDITKKSILAKAFRGELGSNDLDEESSIELLKDLIK